MISNKDLEKLLLATKLVDFVAVEGDGYHYELTVVSDVFVGKSKVVRQKWVYSQLKDLITSGSLHAVNMKAWTKKEWEDMRG